MYTPRPNLLILACIFMQLGSNAQAPFLLNNNTYRYAEAGTTTFTKATSFVNGRAAVCRQGKWALLKNDGSLLTPFAFNEIGEMQDGFAVVITNGECGYIDSNGKQSALPVFTSASRVENGYSLVAIKNQFFSLHLCSGKLNPLAYEKVLSISENTFAVSDGMHWGFVDTSGKTLIQPMYDEVKSFSEGYAAIKKNGVWGFINRLGQEVIFPQYQEVTSFSGGIAGVNTHGHWQVITPSGEVLFNTLYTGMLDFSEGFAPVLKNGVWGYINKKGEEVIRPAFDYAGPFCNGYAKVFEGSRKYYINQSGERYIEGN